MKKKIEYDGTDYFYQGIKVHPYANNDGGMWFMFEGHMVEFWEVKKIEMRLDEKR